MINNSTLAAEECIGLTPWDADGERADQAEAGVGVRFFLLDVGFCSERGAHAENIRRGNGAVDALVCQLCSP